MPKRQALLPRSTHRSIRPHYSRCSRSRSRGRRVDKKPDIPNLAWTGNGIAIADGSPAAYRHDLTVPAGKQIDELVDGVDGFLTNPNHYLQHAVGKSGHDQSSTVTFDLVLRTVA